MTIPLPNYYLRLLSITLLYNLTSHKIKIHIKLYCRISFVFIVGQISGVGLTMSPQRYERVRTIAHNGHPATGARSKQMDAFILTRSRSQSTTRKIHLAPLKDTKIRIPYPPLHRLPSDRARHHPHHGISYHQKTRSLQTQKEHWQTPLMTAPLQTTKAMMVTTDNVSCAATPIHKSQTMQTGLRYNER